MPNYKITAIVTLYVEAVDQEDARKKFSETPENELNWEQIEVTEE